MKTRTDAELNAIIHRWIKADEPPQPEILLLNTGDGRSYLKDERPPNYCGDLNAIQQAERHLITDETATDWVAHVVNIAHPALGWMNAGRITACNVVLNATARQRAEALVRVIEGGAK